MIRLLLTALCLSACTPPSHRSAARTVTFAPASPTERLTKLPKLLPNARPDLLARVTDAQWAIEQIGDGVLGPSDFVYRIRLAVPPADVPVWLSGSRLTNQDWAEPTTSLPWWIAKAQLPQARFAEASSITGLSGAVAALPDEGLVFVFHATQ